MYDIIFCGGGLAACLTAWRLHLDHPKLKLLIVEQGKGLGGHHTWSFFKADLTESQYQWLLPLIKHSWPQYEIRFPGLSRSFFSQYCSTDSTALDAQIKAVLPPEMLRTEVTITDLNPNNVTLDNNETLQSKCLIDCRGPEPSAHVAIGFQKFTGQVVDLKREHGLAGPIIMDARVAQDNDYRFIYTLPFTPTQVLIEDTRYSSTPEIDTEADQTAIAAYLENEGWGMDQIAKEESGVLPIMLGGDIEGFWDNHPGLPKLGLRAALFHATTGYSFPNAVRGAEYLAKNLEALRSSQQTYELLRQYSIRHFQNQRFLHLLNRMLFMAAQPNERYLILERFYRLPPPLVERFYADQLKWTDMARILIGKPPVSIMAALRCLPNDSVKPLLHNSP